MVVMRGLAGAIFYPMWRCVSNSAAAFLCFVVFFGGEEIILMQNHCSFGGEKEILGEAASLHRYVETGLAAREDSRVIES